ncbi:MAG: hypothetical protein K0U63_04120 [Cyanobacteria bacterium]|nr:hypothetical protein [Cyanobacteriota bacterium]
MLFKRKDSFFLNLNADEQAGAAVQVAMRKPQPAKGKAKPASTATEPARATTATTEPPGATSPATPVAQPASGKPQLTTAEAIAAELREAQESRPAPSSVTFAPDCLNPANAVPSRRRSAGANLAGFKAMAAEMFSS